jgi:D-alanyl-D-alanine carboxypeptidase (penicillin-binding protein 5/6)
MKKLPVISLIFIFIFTACEKKIDSINKLSISSETVVLINLDNGTTVYELNETKKMYPASLTKLVTAMVTLDKVKNTDNTKYEAPFVIFDELQGQGASMVGYSPGEVITVTDLLYSLLIHSACDSAGILAWNVGGTQSKFIDMMNEKATAIGCTDTNFVNPHGLYDSNQYTNAHDMALIAQYAYKNYPKLIEIACTKEYTMKATNYQSEGWKTIKHTNKMLDPNSEYYYQYAKGLKTGTLDESGRCLITIASKEGNNYLLVSLGSPLYDAKHNAVYDVFTDHKNFYDWVFDSINADKS